MTTSQQPEQGWSRVVGAVLALSALLSVLVAAFAWPASQIEPRNVPIAVAGPAPAAAQVEQALGQVFGEEAFAVTTLETRTDVVEAIQDRELYGGLVLDPRGSEMLTASAAGPAVAQMLAQVATGLSAQAPPGVPPVAVTDVVPAPEDDPRGAAFAAGSLPLVLGGIITAAVLALRVRRRSQQVLGALGVAATAGLSIAAVLQFWIGALEGSYLANASVMALGIAAIAVFVLSLKNLLGVAGLGLGAATILLLGNPFSGITSAPELLPGGWSGMGQWMPPGAMGQALRSTAFFDGAAVGNPLWVLGIWLAVGLALMTIRGRRTEPAVDSQAAAADVRVMDPSPAL